MIDLRDRVVLITGGGRGIGRATARLLADAGARVVVTARTSTELEEVVASIQRSGGSAAAIVCDLAERNQSQSLLEKATACFGAIDILVNNAGIGSSAHLRPLASFDDTFWDRTLEINLTVPYLLAKHALPAMLEQKWGRIITIASINGRVTTMHAGAYAASKHGVLGLMRSLALEHAADGITVNCVCPGPVETRMNDIRIRYDADRLGRSVEDHERLATPIGGRLSPDDIAPMVRYLCSDDARMITGQAYNVDGGICMA